MRTRDTEGGKGGDIGTRRNMRKEEEIKRRMTRGQKENQSEE